MKDKKISLTMSMSADEYELMKYSKEELVKKLYRVKQYAEELKDFEDYEIKNKKLSRTILNIREGLTTHYKMRRVAYNILNILEE